MSGPRNLLRRLRKFSSTKNPIASGVLLFLNYWVNCCTQVDIGSDLLRVHALIHAAKSAWLTNVCVKALITLIIITLICVTATMDYSVVTNVRTRSVPLAAGYWLRKINTTYFFYFNDLMVTIMVSNHWLNFQHK